MEGEFYLVATTDSTGHITVVADLNPNAFPPSWSGKISVVVEAGQVEKLARDAKVFFVA